MALPRAISQGLVALPSGLRLELSLTPPQPNVRHNRPKLAVLLHPWSWLGGSMNDPVLHTLISPLLARGYTVLRYNSRGVGKSSGWPSLTGIQEGTDLREVVQWALTSLPDTQRVLIVGYSHGSLIASQHPPFTASLASPSESSTISNSNPIPTAHILLSYPLSPLPFLTLFHTRTYRSALTALIQSPDSRVLVLFGDRDEFTSGENYETWSEELQREMHAAGMEHHNIEANRKLRIVRVEGANHFWAHGKLAEMCESIEQWVDDLENP